MVGKLPVLKFAWAATFQQDSAAKESKMLYRRNGGREILKAAMPSSYHNFGRWGGWVGRQICLIEENSKLLPGGFSPIRIVVSLTK
jgi:hypothetical protein